MAIPSRDSDYDYIFKLVLTGDSSVGKSNLLLRFTRNQFHPNYQATIGVEFACRELTIKGKRIQTQVWDTAGTERFKTVIPQYYRGSAGALVVFDLTEPKSLDHIKDWIEELHRHVPPDLPIVLVGNKSDLVDERKVSLKQATALAEQLHVSYMETSALNASNVEEAFHTLVTIIYNKMPKSVHNSPPSTKKPIEEEIAPTIPVSYNDEVPIPSNRNSFYLDDDQKPTDENRNRCCKNF